MLDTKGGLDYTKVNKTCIQWSHKAKHLAILIHSILTTLGEKHYFPPILGQETIRSNQLNPLLMAHTE